MADRQYLEQLSRKLADEGKLIEAGWVAFRAFAVPPDASPPQLSAMRIAYMSGAQHLFASIMTLLDPGEEATEADFARLDLISTELETFYNQMKLRYGKPQGTA